MEQTSPEDLIEYFQSLDNKNKADNYVTFCKELIKFENDAKMTKEWVVREASVYFGIEEIHSNERLNGLLMLADHSVCCLECWGDFVKEVHK